jgi:hypothetical protein
MDFVWRNKGALTVATVLETFLADPESFPQCLLARCLPQREHDRQPCASMSSGRSALRERIRIWLRLATDRLGAAQNERIRAVVKAYQLGLWI